MRQTDGQSDRVRTEERRGEGWLLLLPGSLWLSITMAMPWMKWAPPNIIALGPAAFGLRFIHRPLSPSIYLPDFPGPPFGVGEADSHAFHPSYKLGPLLRGMAWFGPADVAPCNFPIPVPVPSKIRVPNLTLGVAFDGHISISG